MQGDCMESLQTMVLSAARCRQPCLKWDEGVSLFGDRCSVFSYPSCKFWDAVTHHEPQVVAPESAIVTWRFPSRTTPPLPTLAPSPVILLHPSLCDLLNRRHQRLLALNPACTLSAQQVPFQPLCLQQTPSSNVAHHTIVFSLAPSIIQPPPSPPKTHTCLQHATHVFIPPPTQPPPPPPPSSN